MGSVEPLYEKPREGVDVHWVCLKEFEKTEDGQLIVLGRSMNQSGEITFGVLIMSGVDVSADGFDIIAEYPGTQEGRQAAEYAASIADRTLSASCMLLPEPTAA